MRLRDYNETDLAIAQGSMKITYIHNKIVSGFGANATSNNKFNRNGVQYFGRYTMQTTRQ